MKTALLFPPGWQDFYMPYLRLPALKAHMEACGQPTVQVDRNIALFEEMPTPGFLGPHRQWVERTFEEDGGA